MNTICLMYFTHVFKCIFFDVGNDTENILFFEKTYQKNQIHFSRLCLKNKNVLNHNHYDNQIDKSDNELPFDI